MAMVLKVRIALTLIVLSVFVYAGIEAIDFRRLARSFPLAMSLLGGASAAMLLITDLVRNKRAVGGLPPRAATEGSSTLVEAEVEGRTSAVLRGLLRYVSWLVGFMLAVRLVGIGAAAFVFLIAFRQIEADSSWRGSILGAVGALVVMEFFARMLSLTMPRSLWSLPWLTI